MGGMRNGQVGSAVRLGSMESLCLRSVEFSAGLTVVTLGGQEGNMQLLFSEGDCTWCQKCSALRFVFLKRNLLCRTFFIAACSMFYTQAGRPGSRAWVGAEGRAQLFQYCRARGQVPRNSACEPAAIMARILEG